MNIDFSPQQQKTIANATTGMAMAILAMLVFFIARAFLTFLDAFSAVLMPFVTALILSMLLRPVFLKLRKQRWIPDGLAVALILLMLVLPFLLLLGVFGGLIVSQVGDLLTSLPTLWDRLVSWLEQNAPAIEGYLEPIGGREKLQQWLQEQSDTLLALAADGAQGIVTGLGSLAGLFSWFVLPVYLIFLMMMPPVQFEKTSEFLPFLKPAHREDAAYLLKQFVEIVVSFFRGQLVIAGAQGILMAIGFSVCGLSYGFVLGLLFGMLNLIPYLGSAVSIAIAVPLAWFQPGGGWGVLLGVGVTMGVVQMVEAYILTPRIMGKSTGLHPLAVIFAMFFWGTALGGIFGLILAIPLTAFLVVCWRLAKEKYFPQSELQS